MAIERKHHHLVKVGPVRLLRKDVEVIWDKLEALAHRSSSSPVTRFRVQIENAHGRRSAITDKSDLEEFHRIKSIAFRASGIEVRVDERQAQPWRRIE